MRTCIMGIAAFCLLGAPAPTLSQDECETVVADSAVHYQLASDYAPTLTFAPGEPYFPMNPLALFFDQGDNDGDGVFDYDPDEVTPLAYVGSARSGAGPLPEDWEPFASRDVLLDEDLDQWGRPEHPAVFYSVKRLTGRDRADLWHYLRSDEQTWERLTDSVATRVGVTPETEFLSIQYYFYFPQDIGVGGGHPWDLEAFAVYVPEDDGIYAGGADRLADDFRLYVGAGHTELIANNGLVMTRDAPVDVIVEFGDHSLAPDVGVVGAFEVGTDVNMHVSEAWGVRDAQSRTGLGAIGPWAPWMASERDLDADRDERPFQLVPDPERQGAPGDSRFEKGYRLLSTDVLRCLFEEVNGLDTRPSLVGDYLDLLRRQGVGASNWSWSSAQGGVAIDQDGIIGALEVWEKGLHLGSTERQPPPPGAAEDSIHYLGQSDGPREDVSNIFAWRNKHFLRPAVSHLKRHLFRPVLRAPRRLGHAFELFEPMLAYYPDRATSLQLGLIIPAFYTGPKFLGYLQLQAGRYFETWPGVDESSWTISAIHTSAYSRTMAWYVRVSWIEDLGEIDALNGEIQEPSTTSVSDWQVEFGAQFIPPFYRHVRLRGGIALDARLVGDDIRGPSLVFMVSPFRLTF